MIDTKDTNPAPQHVEYAARTFASNIGTFNQTVDNLSLKSAKRIIKAIVKWPLNDDNEQLIVHDSELKLFEKAMELMEAKMIMVEHVRAEQEAKKAEENLEKLVPKGEENGTESDDTQQS